MIKITAINKYHNALFFLIHYKSRDYNFKYLFNLRNRKLNKLRRLTFINKQKKRKKQELATPRWASKPNPFPTGDLNKILGIPTTDM